jgi:hypothetical protein
MRHRTNALALAFCATVATAQIQTYATLNAAQEVPPTTSTATGVGRATFNENGTVTYFVTTSGLTGAPTVAHIHQGNAGGNGGAFVTLTPIPGTNDFKGTSAVITAGQRNALLTDGCYFNVHTAAFPGGEIRGQILGVRRSRFKATLDQAQETPPSGSAATGTAEVWLSEPENVITYEVDTVGLAASTAAHIHAGAVGVAGPVVVGLNGAAPRFCGAAVLAAADVVALKASGLYFNVHTAAFPGGEIRGQIVPAKEQYTVYSSGNQETPPNASVHTACATFVYDPVAQTLQYQINTTLPAISAMHLHTGAIGQSGPVSIGLTGTPPVMTGTVSLTSAVHLANLRRGNLYLNQHTNAFPGGELRGNLRHAADPYGFGSPDSAGLTPRLAGSGYVTHGTPFEVNLFDAAPNQPYNLYVGTQELFWPVVSAALPYDASIIAPCAFIWTDWDPFLFLSGTTDAQGCATQTITLPASPAFDCLRLIFQGFVADPTANAFGFVVSDALQVRLAQTTLPY